jgi:phosphatidylglycerol---prolipoprotein diacylglyceryl transferase
VLLAESIVHTCDKFLWQISGGFGIRWYGLSYAVGFLVGWAIVRWLAKTGRTRISTGQAGDLVTALAVGVLAGGRLGHILFYEPELLIEFNSSFPFWELLNLQRGGMSSHGGVIGVVLATMWFARRTRMPFLAVGDLAACAAPIGLGLGRLANWINGELPGRELPAAAQANPPWWSVKYPTEMLEPNFVNANRLVDLEWMRSQIGARSDEPLAQALVEACYRQDADVIAKVAPLLTARYPINFMQAFTDGVVLPLVLAVVWLRPRPFGWVAGWFLLAYGVLRFTTEQFRVPDPDILPGGFITMPVALSCVMCAAGIAILMRTKGSDGLHGGLVVHASQPAA